MPPKKNVKRKADEDPMEEALPTKKTATAPAKPSMELKIKNDYPLHYRNAKNDSDKQALFNQIVDEENHYRELYAQDRSNALLDNPHLLLVDVHKNEDIFNTVNTDGDNLPRVFPLDENKKPPNQTSIVGENEFKRNFDVFSEFQLRYLNWDNIFLAGGSVLACLQPVPEAHAKDNVSRRNYFHNLAYKSSDIDIFIYGIDDESKANEKVDEIYQAVLQSIPVEALAFRSTHAITIVSQYPYRHIQIVLRLYKSPAEILMGFDVDSCSVGFDGRRVWMTPRAHRSLTHQYNAVDMSRRSPSYEMRLAKYATRGFEVLVPTLNRDLIDPQLFERRFDQLQGLAKLILLEKLDSPEARTKFKEQQRMRRLRPELPQRQSLFDLDDYMDDWNDERIREAGGADASDYSTVFLPWGPKWSANKIRKMMYTKDMILNSKWYDKKKKHHTHPCFFGTIKEIMEDCCGCCPPVPPEELEVHDSMYVSGKAYWITVNPGQQSTAKIGSFHPITEGDWTEGAYISKEAETLFMAINKDDVNTVEKCLKSGIAVSTKDGVGRFPLHIAAFCNAVKVTKLLLANGARISSKTQDGRTALHIAAQYGNAEVVKMILDRAKEIAQEGDAEMTDKKGEGKKGGKKEKKGAKKPVKKPKKKKGSSDEDMDEDEEGDEENEDDDGDGDGEENEDGDEDGGDGEDEDFESIKSQIEKRKKEREQQDIDPTLASQTGADILDINEPDWDNKMNPLHYAVFFGAVGCLKHLIDAGVDKTQSLKYKSDNSRTIKSYSLLHLAIMNNQVETVKELLNMGVSMTELDLQHESVLHKAASLLNVELLELFLTHNEKLEKSERLKINAFNLSLKTPLILALNAPYQDQGKDFDPNMSDPCFPQKFDVVSLLVKHGASVEYKEDDLPSQAESSQFSFKSGKSKSHTLRSLVSQPLIIACEMGSPKLVEFFRKKKVRLNWVVIRGYSAFTPLDIITKWIEAHEKEDKKEKEEDWKDNLPPNKDSLRYFLSYLYHARQQQRSYNRTRKAFRRVPIKRKRKSDSSDSESESDDTEEGKKKAEETRKAIRDYQLSLRKQIETILKNNDASLFVQLKLKSKDNELLDIQYSEKERNAQQKLQKARKESKKISDNEFEMKFQNIPESIPGVYMRSRNYEDEEHTLHLKLFEAVFEGHMNLIDNLTTKRDIGKQAHIASKSVLAGISLFMIATMKNSVDLFSRLVSIAQAQYTPLRLPEKAVQEKTKSINNYELANIIKNFRPGFSPVELIAEPEFEKIDPNAPRIQLNCITNPATVLTACDEKGWNILHYAAYYGSNNILASIPSLIEKFGLAPSDYSSRNKQRRNNQKPEGIIEQLLAQSTHSHGLTPFELAIARGNVDSAALLIKMGSLAQEGPKPKEVKEKAEEEHSAEEDEDYKGLNVGGKKMEWVDFSNRKKEDNQLETRAVHIACEHGQPKALKWLVRDAVDIWKSVNKSDKLPLDLCLDAQDEETYTVYHTSVFHKTTEFLELMYELDTDRKLVNKGTKKGITPLHVAAATGKIEAAKLLIKSGANLEARENRRNWTPLFFAISSKNVEMVKLLLDSKADLNGSRTKNYAQTPLMLSCYYGRKEITSILLEAKSDIHIVDRSGETALHLSVKEDHLGVVKLLLHGRDPAYFKESGLGLNPLDISILRLLSPLPEHRVNEDDNDVSICSQQREIYHFLRTTLGTERELVRNAEVIRITELMLNSALNEAKKESGGGKRRKRRVVVEEGSADEKIDLSAPHDFESTDIPNPIADEKFVDLPSPPSQVDENPMDYVQEDSKKEPLKGMIFTVLDISDMKAIKRKIEQNGGTYLASITKSVTHVVVPDVKSSSIKIRRAKDEGKTILNEKELDSLIQGQGLVKSKEKDTKTKKSKKQSTSSEESS